MSAFAPWLPCGRIQFLPGNAAPWLASRFTTDERRSQRYLDESSPAAVSPGNRRKKPRSVRYLVSSERPLAPIVRRATRLFREWIVESSPRLTLRRRLGCH